MRHNHDWQHLSYLPDGIDMEFDNDPFQKESHLPGMRLNCFNMF